MSKDHVLSPLAQSILSEALTWPISARLDLIERILETFDTSGLAAEPEWLKQAYERLAAYRSEEFKALDAEQISDATSQR